MQNLSKEDVSRLVFSVCIERERLSLGPVHCGLFDHHLLFPGPAILCGCHGAIHHPCNESEEGIKVCGPRGSPQVPGSQVRWKTKCLSGVVRTLFMLVVKLFKHTYKSDDAENKLMVLIEIDAYIAICTDLHL